MTEQHPPGGGDEAGDEAGGDGIVDRLRDSPVGTNDPNIVGDVGPTDTPPGRDPEPPDDGSGQGG